MKTLNVISLVVLICVVGNITIHVLVCVMPLYLLMMLLSHNQCAYACL